MGDCTHSITAADSSEYRGTSPLISSHALAPDSVAKHFEAFSAIVTRVLKLNSCSFC